MAANQRTARLTGVVIGSVARPLADPMTETVVDAPQLRIVMPDMASSSSSTATLRPAANKLPTPASGFKRLEPTPELLEHLHTESLRLESATPEQIIAWGVENYAPYFT